MLPPRPRLVLGACFLLTAATAIAVGAPALFKPSVTAPAKAAFDLAAPRPVVALGRLEPISEVIRLASPTNAGQGARIARLLVEEGALVTAGQVLAELDSLARGEAELKAAEADLALKAAQLARARLQTEADLAARRMELARAEADLAVRGAVLHRSATLAKEGFTSTETLEARRLERERAQHTAEEARARLARAQAIEGGAPVDVTVAQREWAAAEAGVARARAALEDALIRAPIEGRVLTILARAGERIGADGVLEMGATDRMMAIVEIYESDVGRIAIGQAAELRAPALGAAALTGQLTRIGLSVRRQSVVNADPSANTDARVVEARILLDPVSSQRAADFTRLQIRATLLAR